MVARSRSVTFGGNQPKSRFFRPIRVNHAPQSSNNAAKSPPDFIGKVWNTSYTPAAEIWLKSLPAVFNLLNATEQSDMPSCSEGDKSPDKVAGLTYTDERVIFRNPEDGKMWDYRVLDKEQKSSADISTEDVISGKVKSPKESLEIMAL